MKNQKLLYFSLGVFTSFVILLAGCSWFSPSSKQTRAENKVTETKSQIVDNKDKIIEQSKGYVFGANTALSLNPETNRYTDIAKQMVTRAQTSLGEPSMADMVKMTAIIQSLLSDKQEIVARGEKMLKEKDDEIINLQEQNQELSASLKEKEAKFVDISRVNAALADKWVRLKNMFWWTVYAIIGIILLRSFGSLLPPPWNNIFTIFDYIVGGIIRAVIGIFPKAKETAKVVGAEYKVTTEHLVDAIQQFKDKNKTQYEELKPILADNTSKEVSRLVIDNTKQELGYV